MLKKIHRKNLLPGGIWWGSLGGVHKKARFHLYLLNLFLQQKTVILTIPTITRRPKSTPITRPALKKTPNLAFNNKYNKCLVNISHACDPILLLLYLPGCVQHLSEIFIFLIRIRNLSIHAQSYLNMYVFI